MGMHFRNNFSGSSSDLSPSFENSTNQFSAWEDGSLASTTDLSLSVNYLPSKFSEFGSRKLSKYDDDANPALPETGGGLLAFRTNVIRIFQGKGSLRWNRFKWTLFGTNTLVCLLQILVTSAFSNYTAHALFHDCFHHLLANMVRYLGKGRCHTHRKRTRTSRLNIGSFGWHANLSDRLGRYSPQ
jgi:hypothetical protein